MSLGVLQLTALTLLLAALVLSTLTATLYRRLRPRLALLEPHGRARALFLLCAAPMAGALVVTLACFAPSAVSALWGIGDHCASHPDTHAHFCLKHSDASGGLLGWIVLGGASAMALVRAGQTVRRLARSSRRAHALLATSQPRGETRVVETDVPLALTVGLRDPEIIVSSSLLASIDESHIEAIVAHEKAHAARRDNVTKLVARALTILWWPRARASVLEDLGLACEEACDERAAEVVGDRLLVAEAILAVRRISAGSTDVLASAFGQDATAARVRSLIAEERGRPLRLGRAVLVLAVVLVVTLGMSDPLHDAVETLVSLAT